MEGILNNKIKKIKTKKAPKGVSCGQKSSKSKQIGFHNGTSPTCRILWDHHSHSAAHSSAVGGTMWLDKKLSLGNY